MDSKTQYRFTELLLAIVIVAIALVWAERLAWNQISTLRQENHAFVEKLSGVDRAETQSFLEKANASLTRLQRFLFVALLCLLVSGATLIVIAYRRTIAPLRTTLTESRAIIERQEKLASLGVFATGIAHEIRNPLTAIKVRLFSLKQSHRPGSSEHEDILVIGSEIDRLERIVKEFLQFAKPADPDLELVSIRNVLQEMAGLVEKELSKKGIALKLEIEADEMVRIDTHKFKQVLYNLVQNGAESIAGEGTVTLRVMSDRRVLREKLQPVIVVEVIDTGAGMPLEIQKRLFDPFFTTKEQGTGLGLPISARIVEKHGGAMQYQTAPNRGTTFSIILPGLIKDETELENTPGGG